MLKDTGLIFSCQKCSASTPGTGSLTFLSIQSPGVLKKHRFAFLPLPATSRWDSGRGTGQLEQLGHKCIMRKYIVPARVWVSGCHPEARDPRAPFMGKRG